MRFLLFLSSTPVERELARLFCTTDQGTTTTTRSHCCKSLKTEQPRISDVALNTGSLTEVFRTKTIRLTSLFYAVVKDKYSPMSREGTSFPPFRMQEKFHAYHRKLPL